MISCHLGGFIIAAGGVEIIRHAVQRRFVNPKFTILLSA